jgi:hypothetical protein
VAVAKAALTSYVPTVSQAAPQAAAFRREVLERGEVWVVQDERGVPAPVSGDGRRAMPFWSSRARAERAADAEQFAGCRPRRLTLREFEDRWLPGLERDGLLVGVNWTGARFTGYDVEPAMVRGWVAAPDGGES